MGSKRTDESHKDAVRIALSSGLKRALGAALKRDRSKRTKGVIAIRIVVFCEL
jgi:hypothetical protein